MAMIKCPECGRGIPADAILCPYCGQAMTITDKRDKYANSEYVTPHRRRSRKIKPAFYRRGWFIILMLIVFFPVGIVLLWNNKKFNKVIRIVLSVICCAHFMFWSMMFIGLVILPDDDEWTEPTVPTVNIGLESTDDTTTENDLVSATKDSNSTNESEETPIEIVAQKATGSNHGYSFAEFTVKNVSGSTIHTLTLNIKILDENETVLSTTHPQEGVLLADGEIIVIEALTEDGAYAMQLDGYSYHVGNDEDEKYVRGYFSDTEPVVLCEATEEKINLDNWDGGDESIEDKTVQKSTASESCEVTSYIDNGEFTFTPDEFTFNLDDCLENIDGDYGAYIGLTEDNVVASCIYRETANSGVCHIIFMNGDNEFKYESARSKTGVDSLTIIIDDSCSKEELASVLPAILQSVNPSLSVTEASDAAVRIIGDAEYSYSKEGEITYVLIDVDDIVDDWNSKWWLYILLDE